LPGMTRGKHGLLLSIVAGRSRQNPQGWKSEGPW
jgi:hypothetical protein